jgi:microcin C transport system permease protein
MGPYILKRFLLIFPTLLGIVTVCFLFTQIVPGGPVEVMMAKIRSHHSGPGGEADSGGGGNAKLAAQDMEKEQIAYLKKLYGLDLPMPVQYWNWLKRLFTFNFGESYFHNKKVTTLILEKLPVSATLGVFGLLSAYLISIPLGIARAVRAGSKFDTAAGIAILIAYSIPGFVLAVFLLVIFGGGSFLSWFPLRGLTSDNFATLSSWGKFKDYLWHIVLPLIAYSLNGFAILTLTTRNLFLEEIHQQYVTTARAKGLTERVILWKHVYRNAMILIVSGFPSALIAMFFGSSLLIETVFSLDGLGLLSYESVMRRDYPFFLTNIFLLSLVGLVAQIISDLVLVVIDPRITFDKVSSA